MIAVTPQVQFDQLEREVLDYWDQKNIFQQQDAKRQNAPQYSFNDGPPFANGLPHYGHLLANTIKDTVPRYWIMRGFQVDRRFGWDCHGLPVEFEIEKRYQLKGKPDILKMGVDSFNEKCRESVLHYVGEWQKTIRRLGRWVKWDKQYRTMDRDYMESVWWVFSELYRKNLIYQDFKVVPYSPRTASVVSNFEANQNYKQIQDPSIVVKFRAKEDKDTWYVVWTTTPWTLPSNLCLAVHAETAYVKVRDKKTGELRIIAKKRLHFLYPFPKGKNCFPEGDSPYEVIETFLGEVLRGKKYEPLFDYFLGNKNSFQITCANFVTTEEGTGIVHQAPAYGEDDFYTCKELQIDLVDPIDDSGHFDRNIPDFKGVYFKDADKLICKKLKDNDRLLRHETIVHSYPFDERTDTPLMYKAVPSWYVAVETISANLMKNNQTINWVPGHIKDGRMGTWLNNARDWAISRNRFWGTPIPIWVCDKNQDHKVVMSSVSDLEKRVGAEVTDIHKHYMDKLLFSCDQCSGNMKNIGVVLDCWFESASMPYAQLHYPFENKELLKTAFPADFVAEGLDQTRGWFYTSSVLSNALFDKPAFKNVIVNGVILDKTGKKMSKRHRNYTPPEELIDKYGADSVRLYMLNSPLLKADDLIFSDKGVHDITRQVLLPLWNSYSFLSTYAKADGWLPKQNVIKCGVSSFENDLDAWIISRLNTLKVSMAAHMESYKLYLVVSDLLGFVEDLTNWYIRLSRRRFWGDVTKTSLITSEQDAAYTTLFCVLLDFVKLFAPFAPFVSDRLYRNLVEGLAGALESVHLCDMPSADLNLIDRDLEYYMELTRKAISQGRFLRQKHKLKIRQILPSITIVVADENEKALLQRGSSLIKSELNVKDVFFSTSEADHVKLLLKPNLKSLGKKLGKKVNTLRTTLEEMNKKQQDVVLFLKSLQQKEDVCLGEYKLLEGDILVQREPKDSQLISSERGVTVLLNTQVTPELKEEGLSREVINRIQNLRKDSGLEVSDRIRLQLVAPPLLVKAVLKHKQYILSETLGTSLDILPQDEKCHLKFTDNVCIDEFTCVIALEVLTD